MIKLDDLDILALENFVLYLHLTSYRFSKITGVPNATAWRVFNRLAELGLIKRDERGFSITVRGIVIAYFYTKKENIRRNSLSALKKMWKYDGDEIDLKHFLEDLYKILNSLNISPFIICFNQPITIATMLYSKINELSEQTKRVIANIFINFFPSVDLSNGCKVIISFDKSGNPYALAADCKKEGMKLNYYCPELMKFLGKESNVSLQRIH